MKAGENSKAKYSSWPYFLLNTKEQAAKNCHPEILTFGRQHAFEYVVFIYEVML